MPPFRPAPSLQATRHRLPSIVGEPTLFIMKADETPIRVFATDIDDTLLGDPASERRFREAWESLSSEARPLLVYNSGCSIAHVQWLVLERRLPSAEFIIGAIGTELHDPVDPQAADEFRQSISPGWDRDTVLRVVGEVGEARLQPPDHLNSHKLSWHWPRATRAEIFRLETRLRDAGLDVSVGYTGGIFLDVIPRLAGKGNALAWLCRRIGVSLDRTLAAGASGNNASVFALPGIRGMLIANASRDLLTGLGGKPVFLSMEKMADGVLAGLEHFKVLQNAAPRAEAPVASH